MFVINIGDVPSIEDSYSSTNGIVTDVIYTNTAASAGKYAVYINSASVFGGADYSVFLQVRSLRGTTGSVDNDMATPIISEYHKSYFVFYLEDMSTYVQNIAIDGLIV